MPADGISTTTPALQQQTPWPTASAAPALGESPAPKAAPEPPPVFGDHLDPATITPHDIRNPQRTGPPLISLAGLQSADDALGFADDDPHGGWRWWLVHGNGSPTNQ